MLPDTLSKIKESLKQRKVDLSDDKMDKLLSILKHYKSEDYIYPGALIRHLNVPMLQAYNILDNIKNDLNILELNYELYCHVCSKFTGEVFETINHIPDDMFCEECGSELRALENCIAVYRVVLNE